MKNIKPMKLALLHKPYEAFGRCHFAVTVAAFFPFAEPDALLPDIAMWKFVAQELGSDAVLDMCMPKPRGEVLVIGKCFPPGGQPASRAAVRLSIADARRPLLDKRLNVFGDRYWQRSLIGTRCSEPLPFTEMPLTYATAFGGTDFPRNPLGKGDAPLPPDARGEVLHPLPNVEHPEYPIVSPDDKPAPASFAPLDFTWPQRFEKAGTHDENWLHTRFPGYADDMDWSIFNAAPQDQQLPAYWRGDETFEVQGMSPGKDRVGGRLPDLVTRCFVSQRRGEAEAFREIAMHAETLWLFPAAERGILIYRGVIEIATDDAEDISNIVVAAERPGEPKGIEHYREVLALRLDREEGFLHAIRDDQLMPAGEPAALGLGEEGAVEEARVAGKGYLQANMRRRAERELEQSKAEVLQMKATITAMAARAGVPPPDLSRLDATLAMTMPPVEPPTRLDELPKLRQAMLATLEQSQAEAKRQHAQALERFRETAQRAGLDPAKVLADAQAKGGGRPAFSAQAHMANLRAMAERMQVLGMRNAAAEQVLNDPALGQKLEQTEKAIDDAYRKFAHLFAAPAAATPEAAKALRDELMARMARGESLQRIDLTGAALAGLDLNHADLRDAILDSADLSGANLTGANLAGAVLARASLAKATLTGAKLTGACLGNADLSAALLSGGVDLSGATLVNAVLTGADLSDADLSGADLIGARLQGARLVRIRAAEAKFINVEIKSTPSPGVTWPEAKPQQEIDSMDLSGASLAGAQLAKAIFISCNVEGVDFSGANLSAAVFMKSRGAGACFHGANLENLRVVMESAFAAADFSGAKLDRANLRGTDLSAANFAGASLVGADLSECRLGRADLSRIDGRQLRLAKADLALATLRGSQLAEGVLQKARLQGASLRDANLYCADLLKIVTDPATDFTGTNLKRTLLWGRLPR